MKTMNAQELAVYLRRSGFEPELPFVFRMPEADVGLAGSGPCGELVCRRRLRLLPGRRLVCAGEWRGRRVVVKFYFDPRKARRHWKREAAGLASLKKAGLATAKILAGGRGEAGAVAFLVLAELPGAKTLLELWESENTEQERRRLLASVAAVIADHHRAGLLQTDNHWGNFLFSGGRVYTIDGDAVRVFAANRELDRRRSLDNLALFLAEPYPGIDDHLEFCWQAYCERRQWRPAAGEVEKLAARAAGHRLDKAEKFVRKAGRACTAFACRRENGRFLLADRFFLNPVSEKLLARPDELLAAGEVLKAGNSSTVVRLRLENLDLVVKRYNIKHLRHAVSRGFRPTRAYVSWRNAQRLKWWGVATPEPLAMIEKRIGGLRSTAWYISRHVAGRPALELLPELDPSGPELAFWLERFAELLQRLINLRLVHGDFKASNFLCAEDGRLYLLDLDAMRYHRRPDTAFRKAVARDHRRLLANWRQHPDLEQAFQVMTAGLSPAKN